ncbi:U32 family peptidase [Mycoplasmoides pirum]|uniref:U32 family peptidase n=1 Tax=Mycoplasmoides pirum TaxID=2122 RepID=UPI0004881E95|nr:U32 family peptidase [Mycoplasmoides pirum]
MKLITMPFDYEQAINFIENKIDCILIGNKEISLRCANYFTWNEIKKITLNKLKTKVFILVNQFFFEPDLKKLLNNLKKLNELPIDGIYFQDYAIPQLCKENNLKFNLIYHPETMVTSYGQFPFFLKNNINHLVLSRELFKSELLTICKNKPKKMKLEIQAHGFLFIMHSRWKMISNFNNYANLRIDSKKFYWIKETLRKYPNAIFEDKFGTHMFSGYELCIIKIINELKNMNIDFIRIDNIMQNKEWCFKITYLYDELLKLIKENKVDERTINLFWNKAKDISKPNEISLGFLGSIKDNLHLIKNEKK